MPLIIRWPGKLKPAKVDEQLISLIDVTATSLAAAKIEVTKHLQGNLFIGKNAKPRQYLFGLRQRSGGAVDDMRSITDGQFKLIWNRMPEIPWMQINGYKKMEYPAYALFYQLQREGKLESPVNKFMALKKPRIELFDLKTDPLEFNNLADNQKYNDIKQKLYTILVDSLKQFEKNRITEKPETIEKAKMSSDASFKSGMEKIGLSVHSTDKEIVKCWESKFLEK